MSNPEIKSKILDFLRSNYPKDFAITELVKILSYHRTTVSKYIEVLKAEKKIENTRNIGNTKLYTIIPEKKK